MPATTTSSSRRLRAALIMMMTASVLLTAAILAPAGASAAAGPTILTQPPAFTNATTQTITFDLPGAPGTPSFFCSLDGATATSCTSPAALNGLAEGAHKLDVYATYVETQMLCVPMPPGPDMCIPMPMPVTTDTTSVSFTIDRTAPAVTFTSGRPDRSASKSANITFGFDVEAGATLACALDGAPLTGCSSPLALKKLKPGVHVLSITPTDSAGNTGAAATRTFAINTKKTTYKFTPTGYKKCTKKKRKGGSRRYKTTCKKATM